ncbi:MAG: hypothetical protein ABIW38_02540, partial [Ferruginibacter sp.]
PLLTFKGNNIINSSTSNAEPIIHLFGTQYSLIEHNIFINSNKDKLSISFEDNVRAAHTLKGNTFQSSGGIMENKFVEAKANVVK